MHIPSIKLSAALLNVIGCHPDKQSTRIQVGLFCGAVGGSAIIIILSLLSLVFAERVTLEDGANAFTTCTPFIYVSTSIFIFTKYYYRP